MRSVHSKEPVSHLCLAAWALVSLVFPLSAVAEQLPIKNYTVADGLAHDRVRNIIRDSRGFLWFLTVEGVSRFDGYRFVNYGLEHGLPSNAIHDLLETRGGDYWVATSNGVARFNPTSAGRRFTAYPVGGSARTNDVRALYEDHAGRIWIGTADGLFRMEESDGRVSFRRLEHGLLARPNCVIARFVEDADGALWVSANMGLVRRLSDGRMIEHTMQGGPGINNLSLMSLYADRDRRFWMALGEGLLVFNPEPAASVTKSGAFPWRTLTRVRAGARRLERRLELSLAPGEARLYLGVALKPHDTGHVLRQTADGRMWVGAENGLFEFDGAAYTQYTKAHGLSDDMLVAITEDRDGNLWAGSFSHGAMKIFRHGFISFTTDDGLGHARVLSISEDLAGAVHVKSGPWFISRFDGERFTATQPNLPASFIPDEWNYRQSCLRDHAGEWWVPTRNGLYRFPKVERIEQLARARPKAVYTTRDGLPHNSIGHIFEDSRGDIWMGTGGLTPLVRWERATGAFHGYSDAQGVSVNSAFCEDAAGNLWLGFSDRLARYRDGRIRFWTTANGAPTGAIRSLHLDRERRLWVATSLSGLIRIDNPQPEEPSFKIYTVADGLASNNVRCITEDAWGRIYVGLGRGVDRLDPATGRIRHYTTDDGLANSFVNAAFRDRRGHLWFGMLQGLSRLIPEPDGPADPPPVWINGLRIAGEAYPVHEMGVTEISLPALSATQNRIQIDFYGLNFSAGGALRYQYMIEGMDQDWSAPGDRRAFDASLAPGRYRFLARAINANGLASPAPAAVSFTILPPFWKRWWFITLIVLTLAAAVFTFERHRVARLIELERVRMRIATDLHDDIGAGLSRIAILSEVAQGRLATGDLRGNDYMTTIATSSRELLDSMSDIVWAINPKKEHLKDLIQRMRRFASDLLTARNIAFRFIAPEGEQDVKLSADMRREFFLIFKEGVNNLARHSGASEVEIALRLDRRWLTLEIRDNGRGFDASSFNNCDKAAAGPGENDGHGLLSMRERARRLGGELEIISAPGRGVAIGLRAPLYRHWWGEKQSVEDPRRRNDARNKGPRRPISSFFSRLNKRGPRY